MPPSVGDGAAAEVEVAHAARVIGEEKYVLAPKKCWSRHRIQLKVADIVLARLAAVILRIRSGANKVMVVDPDAVEKTVLLDQETATTGLDRGRHRVVGNDQIQ